ncbi:MAG: hypothetical protein ACRDPL_00455, partial [Propionibacteriaceae bacterium]
RSIGRGKFLGLAFVAVPPVDWELISQLLSQSPTAEAHRRVRVIVDLTTGDFRTPFIEQSGHGPHQPGLALTALAEENQIMASEYCAFQLRQHGLIEADNAREGGSS